MALMKAKTAYAKASSVDKVELELSYVQSSIQEAVSVGRFKAMYYVNNDDEVTSAVLAALQAAGYSVTEDRTFHIIDSIDHRPWYQGLLEWIPFIGDPHVLEDSIPTLNYTCSFIISWELIRETKKV